MDSKLMWTSSLHEKYHMACWNSFVANQAWHILDGSDMLSRVYEFMALYAEIRTWKYECQLKHDGVWVWVSLIVIFLKCQSFLNFLKAFIKKIEECPDTVDNWDWKLELNKLSPKVFL